MTNLQRQKEKKHLGYIERFRHFSYISSLYIQYFIAFIIGIAIILSFWSLPQQFYALLDISSDSLIDFLKYVINMIIALELIRVLCHQTLDTIVEILLMAVTRELIIGHMATWEMFVGILAVAVLFAVRKYLYISQLDKVNRMEMGFEEDGRHAPAALLKKSVQAVSPEENTSENEDAIQILEELQ